MQSVLPLIQSVITVSGALIGAFGGAYLANRFAEVRYRKQVDREDEKERTKFYREKGEELYLILSKWRKEHYFLQTGRMCFLQGTYTKDQLKDLINSHVDPETHVKAGVLIALYFIDFEERLKKTHSIIEKSNVVYKSLSHSQNLEERSQNVEKMRLAAKESEISIDELLEAFKSYMRQK
ncbi:hypothetical protein [Rahnella sp. NRRL B-41462]|uniref:hypothetical protein n=1 Tax=Rahnella sp. NRRL B-41462 TaxID=1610579 RepID=UPI001300900E|nr:hypothetical protein [Rahnella sp. NRRL B-41462]